MKLATISTLALVLGATGALAQSDSEKTASAGGQSVNASTGMQDMQGDLIRTRDITGSDIYTTNEANDEGWDTEGTYSQIGNDWNEIGEIEDVVLTKNGDFAGIVAEVGGFLDIADKHVMVAVDDVNLVAADGADYAFVTRLNEEDLEELPDVDEGFWQ